MLSSLKEMRFPRTWLAYACFPLWLAKRALLVRRREAARAETRYPWWNEVAPRLIVGGIPFPGDLDALLAQGVGAVLSCCAEYLDDEDAYRAHGLAFFHERMLDDFPPRLRSLERAVTWASSEIAAGRTVYLHCAAGRGRSVSVALAYLVREQRLSTEEALARVRAARPLANPTWWQLRAVRAFEARVRAR